MSLSKALRARLLRSVAPAIAAALVAPAPLMAQTAAPALDVAAAKTRISAQMDRAYPRLDALYKDIHQHPELAFQEARTAALLAKEMRALGFQVTEGVGKTGLVAIYRNGEGPTVLVRTELDALPVEEQTGLPYASRAQQTYQGKKVFVDHACGHDAHMAWWVGTAQALVAMKDQWRGTLMFVGQPAEETVGGAQAMLDDGVFKRFPKPDYGFAAHTMPAPVGTVLVKGGVATSASDSLQVVFHGRGGHGSSPHLTLDPIAMGAHFVSDVQTVISREKDPGDFGVITIGAFQAGEAGNVIPETATLRLSVRSLRPEVRKQLIGGVERTAKAISDMAGAAQPPTITRLDGTDSVVNDGALIQRVLPAVKTAFGPTVIVMPETTPGFAGSEDFSQFVNAGVPSVYYFVGASDPKILADFKARGQPIPYNHSPFFAPTPEPTIRAGVELLTLSALTVLPAK